jgi:deferrochelatase/peroxidase EfeB
LREVEVAAQAGARVGRSGSGRNLFGQVDGTGNPAFGTPEFDQTVWSAGGSG